MQTNSVQALYTKFAIGAAADSHAVALSIAVMPAVRGAVRHPLGCPRRHVAPRRRAYHWTKVVWGIIQYMMTHIPGYMSLGIL